MLTVAQLKKKLKGIGCVPPHNKSFIPHYKAAQEFFAQHLTKDSKIKAAFFAATLEEPCPWGWSVGIISLTEEQVIYAAYFQKIDTFRLKAFTRKDISNISIIENKNETGVAGITFQQEGITYEFADTNSNIPRQFLQELVVQEFDKNKLKELEHKLRSQSNDNLNSLLF